MQDFATGKPGNPRPGVIFERYTSGEVIVLNPDLTVTITKDTVSTTVIPSYDTWLEWQVDAFDALVNFLPGVKLGAVGIRMAENYEAEIAACRAMRSFYAA
ncbi:hypothetical protein [Deinococcus peraridilitoris]|uniref:Uncharacterized protein n=1 Tax=Deinococcus peraridilitoris (strain DSM 19664 / LMG 22246 / CIP 109416 / KR-200) TaxID=937777 RepID=L0A156_DEIPD|nr:hypothetical protein [Deinococcus peraridilitoris]AFZ66922.1 hypothetical protein Deipe_1376 [Deinococcus peraridilitoris DSM 19664]